MLPRRVFEVLCAAWLAASSAACSGDIGGLFEREADPNEPAPSEESSPFDVEVDQAQLLPFSVRLSRLANLLGVETSDPLLDVVRKNRTSLGDHDFANGHQPDRLWTASRLSLWVRSLKPVCSSKHVRERFPTLLTDPAPMIEAAYGRPATSVDRTAIAEALASEAATLSDDVKYQTVCLAILSSAEFVVQ